MTRANPADCVPRGASLVEILVALTVLLLVTGIALVLFDEVSRSFEVVDGLARQQQGIRSAFDALSTELRLAGFNVDPDGDPDRPDEQLEAACETAIVFRADLDAGSSDSAFPETELAGGAFDTVPTGNDEIIGYVLAKADGSSSDTLEFDADVKPVPRDGQVETVVVENVALVQDDPPFTLYRMTVRHGSTDVQRTPVIDNVSALRLVYYDRSGEPVEPPGGADDAHGLRAAARAAIRRVGLELEGSIRRPGVLARQGRPFTLVGDIKPRNLGMFGIEDPPD